MSHTIGKPGCCIHDIPLSADCVQCDGMTDAQRFDELIGDEVTELPSDPVTK